MAYFRPVDSREHPVVWFINAKKARRFPSFPGCRAGKTRRLVALAFNSEEILPAARRQAGEGLRPPWVRAAESIRPSRSPLTKSRKGRTDYSSMFMMSTKPVTSKISMISGLTWVTTMLPFLFMVFWADSRTRRPAEEI